MNENKLFSSSQKPNWNCQKKPRRIKKRQNRPAATSFPKQKRNSKNDRTWAGPPTPIAIQEGACFRANQCNKRRIGFAQFPSSDGEFIFAIALLPMTDSQ